MGNASIRGTENVVLWADMSFHVFSALLLTFGSLLIHWRLASAKKTASLIPGINRIGTKRKGQVVSAIDRWQSSKRRIFRLLAHMSAWVNIVLAISSAMLALSIFEFKRTDNVVARPVRFLAYTVAYTLMSIAMATFYEIKLPMLYTWVIPSSIVAMLTGWAISYLPHFTQANILFSVFSMIFLAVIPLSMIVSSPFRLTKKLKRFLPLILHYLIGLGFWFVLWFSPLSNPNIGDHPAINLTESIVFLVMEILWIVGMVASFYLINMGEKAELNPSTTVLRTEVTGDIKNPKSLRSVHQSEKGQIVTNLDPRSTKYSMPSAPPKQIFKTTPGGGGAAIKLNQKSAWDSVIVKSQANKKHHQMAQSQLRRSTVPAWSSGSRYVGFD